MVLMLRSQASRMNARRMEELLLGPPGHFRRLFLQDEPFPLDTFTNELILIGQRRADPPVSSALQTYRGQRQATLGKLLSMAAGQLGGRNDVHRGDWLFAEAHMAYALNFLVWLAMYATDDFQIPEGGGEQCLHNFCTRFLGDAAPAIALSSRDQREQRDALISLCLQAIRHVREQEGEVHVENDNPLADLHRDPELVVTWPHVLPSIEEKQAHLVDVEMPLSEMPGHLGTFLTGSFAEDAKRDCYSDIDVCCFCSELPTRDTRAELMQQLQPGHDEGSARFMPFGLEARKGAITVVHMCFISQASQDALFRTRDDEGDEFPLIEISSESLAVGSYYLDRGKILSDTDGLLASYKSQAQEFPQRVRKHLWGRLRTAWERYRDVFLEASQRGDRIASLTALHACTQAGLRALLLKHDIHTDPIAPAKWIPVEIADLPQRRRSSIAGLELAPSDATAPWANRFSDIEQLWVRYLARPG